MSSLFFRLHTGNHWFCTWQKKTPFFFVFFVFDSESKLSGVPPFWTLVDIHGLGSLSTSDSFLLFAFPFRFQASKSDEY